MSESGTPRRRWGLRSKDGGPPSRTASVDSDNTTTRPSTASLDRSNNGGRDPSTSGDGTVGKLPISHSKLSLADTDGGIMASSSSSQRKLKAIGGNSITMHYFEKKLELSTSGASEAGDKPEEGKQAAAEVPPRIFVKTHMYTNGLTMLALVIVMGLAFYNITTTILKLKTYYAAVVYAIVPLGIIFASFAVSCAVRGIFSLILGATSPMNMNTQNYSALKTPIPKDAKLPQIVVQMPVYKESLEEVIKLSYFNVKRAMDYYQAKGGKVKYIICDDGFQVISPEEALARSNFYAKHGIAFTAQPPQNRRGVFKKASNLNYQLSISDRVSHFMAQDPNLEPALLMVWDEWDREFVAAGDLTMDEDCLILLIDADTKVPEHCMYDVVGEFIESPEVAYTQHYTTPFEEQSRNYWEQHISAFTRTIYFQGIAISVAFGDCCPLVGHNAFLRWSAVRKIGYTDETCRPEEIKYWSECSISEDMYIRLANIGAFGRYVMYTGDEFQEGVSLSYMDEVIKIKKFAYGACEMIFNPFKLWPTRGPFNKGFMVYITNKNIAWYQKCSVLTYLSSYLAMGAAIFYCLFEGIMSVLDPKFHDYFLSRAFDIMLTCMVVFTGIGTFCGGIFYQWRRFGASREGGINIFKIFWDQVKWVPTTVLFYNSVLFHVSEVCFIYFFGMKVIWGATAKETSNKSCWEALCETLVGYKWEYIMYTVILAGYSVCIWYFNISLYRGWSIMSYMVSHIAGPLLLNPHIMSLSY